MALFSTAYIGNIEYYSTIVKMQSCVIELHENYIKQSYRNRCRIVGANGVIDLTVPVAKIHGEKQSISLVKIDYDTPWQKLHSRSIESAYRSSPYYEHYIDLFVPLLRAEYATLIELNSAWHTAVMVALNIGSAVGVNTSFTSEYIKEVVDDYRYSISPKKSFDAERFAPYYQVFADKMAFEPNLSVLDLIFCMGPEAVIYLNDTKFQF